MASRTYKAKRKNWRELPKENQWVYGAIFKGKENSYIITNVKVTDEWEDSEIGADVIGYLVDPETICQDTDLTDKNGKKIFEGDIFYDQNRNSFSVGFINCSFIAIPIKEITKKIIGRKWLNEFAGFSEYIEVIGNIFDNPELIGE